MKFKAIKYYLFIFILITLFAFFTYSNSLYNEFVFDDLTNIVRSSAITDLSNVEGLFRVRPSRFISTLSLAINYHFGGFNVFGYHLINLAIHISNAILVFFLARCLQNLPLVKDKYLKKNRLFPVIASLLFAVHPIQTQAVTFISQRATILSAFLFLLSIIFYLKSETISEKIAGRPTRGSRSRKYYIISLLFALLSYFSKENTYILTAVILLINIFFIPPLLKIDKKKVFKIIPYLLIAVLVYYFTFIIPSKGHIERVKRLTSMTQKTDITRVEYIVTEINVVRTYIRLLFFPFNQNVDYDYPISNSLLELPTFLSFVFLSVIIFFALYIYKRNKLLSFSILFFFITLTIESTVIPIADVIFEHRLYLPSVGFVIFISITTIFIYYNLKSPLVKKTYFLFVVFVIFIFSYLSFSRNRVWRNEYILWSDVVTKSPNKARAHYNLGVASANIGQFNQAFDEFKKTINIDPNYKDAYHNLGFIYEKIENFNEAENYYLSAIKVDPKNVNIRNSLGKFYAKHDRFEEAISEYEYIFKIDKYNASAYNNLGVVYMNQGRFKEAIKSFLKALIIKPYYENAQFNLANTYYLKGEFNKALYYFHKILKINPINYQVSYSIGLIYSQLEKYDKAIQFYKKALEIKPDFLEAKRALERI